jgi:tetratricopeptide (TPR) repeat protein
VTPGASLGPYRLIDRLGRGAMGEVWRAHDARLDREVAIKVLPAEVAADADRRARMLREARAAAAIPHPNVVTVFDIDTVDDRDLLVMELVAGETVAQHLRGRGAPPLATGLAWLIAITDALAHAHERGVLHRDIKAANVMVTAAGVIKVLDFGLAKRGGLEVVVAPTPAPAPVEGALDATLPSPTSLDGTVAGSLVGTPMYMAPEQIAGAPPDARTEVFAVGVLAYEILSGGPPFRAATLDALFVEITTTDAPRLSPPIPHDVAALVAAALARDPAARTPTMAALHGALVAAAARHAGPRARRRWPLAVAAAVAVVAVAAVVVGALALRGGDARPAPRPGDALVARALDEYDLFYTDKALSSIRAALTADPTHPRALAYAVLFGGTDADRAAVVARAATLPAAVRGEPLLAAALALIERGPAAARELLADAGDRERGFWAAELAFRAGDYRAALTEYRALAAAEAPRFRGRIYDHYTAVLLWADEVDAARAIGERYHQAFPGEADAVGVHATTLAAAGDYPRATALAEEALGLHRSEDTLAGLGKVVALRGEPAAAIPLYEQSLALAPPARRPVRRAALALLQWLAGDDAAAAATVAPCLTGADAAAPERGLCLWAAAVLDPTRADELAAALDGLATAATPTRPAYGDPAALAALVRARAGFFGGGCVGRRRPGWVPPAAPAEDAVATLERALAQPLDFYGAYHVPFFATWALCEQAALARALGERDRARALLAPARTRAPGRWWLADEAEAE